MKSKQITLDLNYIEEEVNETKIVYKNGVENPKYTDELQIDIFRAPLKTLKNTLKMLGRHKSSDIHSKTE